MMRYLGTTVIPDSPGQFGTPLYEGAEIVAVEHSGDHVTMHYLADVEAKRQDVDIAIAYSGMHITPDMHYVGMFRRSDGRVHYVFIRRD